MGVKDLFNDWFHMSRVTVYVKVAGNRKLSGIFVTKDKIAGVRAKLNKGAKLIMYIHRWILLER